MNTMKWIKIKAVAVAAGLSIAAVTAATVAVSGNFTGSGLSQTDVQFKAFLDHPPAYLRAVYEVDELPFAGGRRGGRGAGTGQTATTTNSLKLDGDNYMLSLLSEPAGSVSFGQFEGTSWHLSVVEIRLMDTNLPPFNVLDLKAMDPDQRQQWMQSRRNSGSRLPDMGRLEIADPKINLPDDTNAQDLVNLGRFSRVRANRLLNLGMEEMIPGTIVWDPDNQGFTASWTLHTDWFPAEAAHARSGRRPGRVGTPDVVLPTSGQLSVRLEYENGLPVKATVRIDPDHVNTINYKYRPDFCNGQFPAELSRVDNAGNTLFSLRLQELDLADQPLPKSELDPSAVFRGKFPVLTSIIHSNGAPYELKDGRLVKPQTPEEYSNMIADMRAKGLIHVLDNQPVTNTNGPIR